MILLAAVEGLATEGALPVNGRILINAEEEVGGDSADQWLIADTRGAAVALILDGSVDELTVGVRGMLYGSVKVTTGTSAQHSGLYGGAALSATDALIPRCIGRASTICLQIRAIEFTNPTAAELACASVSE